MRAFQAANALTPDGIAGARTHRALLPYYTGFVTRTIRAGDTFSALARQYGTSVDAIALANPYLDPERLPLGPGADDPAAVFRHAGGHSLFLGAHLGTSCAVWPRAIPCSPSESLAAACSAARCGI